MNAGGAGTTLGTGGASTATKSSIIDAAVDMAHVERCREELKMMNIKAEVMHEELNEAQMKHNSAKQGMKTKEHSLNLLSSEKEDALLRLRKVQREI